SIALDGAPVGTLPLRLPGIPDGAHVIRVEAPGFVPVEQPIDLSGPRDLELALSRTTNPGRRVVVPLLAAVLLTAVAAGARLLFAPHPELPPSTESLAVAPLNTPTPTLADVIQAATPTLQPSPTTLLVAAATATPPRPTATPGQEAAWTRIQPDLDAS